MAGMNIAGLPVPCAALDFSPSAVQYRRLGTAIFGRSGALRVGGFVHAAGFRGLEMRVSGSPAMYWRTDP